ncbi:p450 domain-containing protein [Cinnamomum micranthum f. kanehirae]|uniref:p450 domain-containing protein n=1 Tax=Cinnamomum micranthum f. kanehirae TaxID=337451 RepID=A0A3S3MT77_9MAGN|nr:p450 domain-containing protein [Cinnamomum micranthum f. kanehirae]
MDFFSSVATIATALILAILLYKFFHGEKRRYHPLAGTFFNQVINFGRLHDYLTDLARKYKTFRIFGVAGPEVYTADPANVEHILKTNFNNYNKGKYQYRILSGLFGDGIFAVDGEKWLQQRKLANHDLSTKVLRDFSSVVFQNNAVKLAQIISRAATSNQTIDIQDLFMKATLDSIFKVGFGTELNTLSGSNEEGNRFAEAFDDSSALTFYRYVDVFWKLKKLLNIGSEAVLMEKSKVLDQFVYNVIETKKEQISSQQDTMPKEDILSRFLVLRQKDPNMSDRYLRDIILSFVIAGKDTTAVTLSWFFYLLCKNPLVQEKIAREVKEVIDVEEGTTIDEFVERLTVEALSRMHYLHAAITETLRLYPAVAVDAKLCCSDDTLPDGFHVRRGDMVAYLPYPMGRMKFLWGDDAEVFKPERWLNNGGVFQPESPFKFTAFQAGPRICAGKEFAYTQMKIFAAVLVSFFTFKLSDEKRAVSPLSMTSITIATALILAALLFKFFNGRKRRYHPLAGTFFNQVINFSRLHDYFTDLARKHKTFRIFGTAGPEVYTADPANVEYILKTNFNNYKKGRYHYSVLSDLLGDGIFAVDGEKWLQQRKLASHDLSTKVLRDFSSAVFQNNAVKLAQIISEAATSNQSTIDIQDLFMKATLDSIFKVGFGTELNTLSGSNEEGNRFAEAFDDSSALTFHRYVDMFWKMKKLLNIGSEAVLKEKMKVMDEFVYKVIQSKKEQICSQQDTMPKEDILSRFLELRHEDPTNMSDRYMRDIILNFIIAGKDTTAVTLSWFFYMLCKNTLVQEKIAREVKDVIDAKEGTTFGEFDGKFCCSDDTFPDGFNVSEGDNVAYLPYPMGRMQFLWGDDAEVFRPERWLNDDGVFQPESPFKFTAFQAGPRICAGKEFAYTQMKIFAAVLVSFFTFKLSDEKRAVRYRTMLTLHIDGGLFLQVFRK